MVRRRFNLLGQGCLAVVCLTVCGCDPKSPPPQPETALGDKPGQYMPVTHASGDLSVLADQQGVKLIEAPKIDYAPLPRPEAAPAPTVGEPKAVKPAKEATAQAGKKSAPASAAGGKSAKRSRISSTLGTLTGILPGSKRPPAAKPPAAVDEGDEESDAEAAPAKKPGGKPGPAKPAAVQLANRRDELANIPDAPASYTPEQMQAIRKAAEEAVQLALLQRVFRMPMDPTQTVGDAIGQPPESFPGKLEGMSLVAAKWADENTLEVEAQISVLELLNALQKNYEDISFDPLRALGEQKYITAQASAQMPGKGDAKKPKTPKVKGGAAVGD